MSHYPQRRHPPSSSSSSSSKRQAASVPERFHGAFTGGFSAGYFNTVGSRDGWKPRSASERGGHGEQQSVHDFMDEDDEREFRETRFVEMRMRARDRDRGAATNSTAAPTAAGYLRNEEGEKAVQSNVVRVANLYESGGGEGDGDGEGGDVYYRDEEEGGLVLSEGGGALAAMIRDGGGKGSKKGFAGALSDWASHGEQDGHADYGTAALREDGGERIRSRSERRLDAGWKSSANTNVNAIANVNASSRTAKDHRAMAGGTFAGIANVMKERFTTGSTETFTHYQPRTQMQSTSTSTSTRGNERTRVTRTESSWKPTRLLSKRFGISGEEWSKRFPEEVTAKAKIRNNGDDEKSRTGGGNPFQSQSQAQSKSRPRPRKQTGEESFFRKEVLARVKAAAASNKNANGTKSTRTRNQNDDGNNDKSRWGAPLHSQSQSQSQSQSRWDTTDRDRFLPRNEDLLWRQRTFYPDREGGDENAAIGRNANVTYDHPTLASDSHPARPSMEMMERIFGPDWGKNTSKCNTNTNTNTNTDVNKAVDVRQRDHDNSSVLDTNATRSDSNPGRVVQDPTKSFQDGNSINVKRIEPVVEEMNDAGAGKDTGALTNDMRPTTHRTNDGTTINSAQTTTNTNTVDRTAQDDPHPVVRYVPASSRRSKRYKGLNGTRDENDDDDEEEGNQGHRRKVSLHYSDSSNGGTSEDFSNDGVDGNSSSEEEEDGWRQRDERSRRRRKSLSRQSRKRRKSKSKSHSRSGSKSRSRLRSNSSAARSKDSKRRRN